MTYNIVHDEDCPVMALIFTVDDTLAVKYASESIQKLGYTPEDFYSPQFNLWSLFHPEEQFILHNRITELVNNEKSRYLGEHRILSKSGAPLWVQVYITRRSDAPCNKKCYQILLTDTSQRWTFQGIQEKGPCPPVNTPSPTNADRDRVLVSFSNSTPGISASRHVEAHVSPTNDPVSVPDVKKIRLFSRDSLRKVRDISKRKYLEKERSVSRVVLEQRVIERTAELEKLNEELYNEIAERKRVEIELNLSQVLLPQLPDGVIVTDLEGIVVRWMGNAEKVFGYSSEHIVGKNISVLHDPTVKDHMLSNLHRMIDETGEFFGEVPCIKKDGTPILIELSVRPVFDENGKHILDIGNNRDVTERKRLEKVLKDNEQLYRDLVESQRDFIVRIDSNGKFTYVNDLYCIKFQKKRQDLIQKEYIPFMLDDPGPIVSNESAKVWTNKETSVPLTVVQYLHTVDGWRWIAWKNFPVRDENGIVAEFQCVGHDITMLKKTEEKMSAYQERLRFLAAEKSMLEERQRRSIAQAIHDNVGQSLANCNFLLESLKISRSRKEFIPKIMQIQGFVTSIIRETRTLTFELSPPVLYELGLGKALRRLSEQILSEHGIQVYFEDDNLSDNLSSDMRGFLFQATRELLVNIVKHAKAHTVTVAVRHKEAETQIRVQDDGVGFEMKKIFTDPEKYSCFGLFSISERIHYLGGAVDISSKPGQGTEVTLSLPHAKMQFEEG